MKLAEFAGKRLPPELLAKAFNAIKHREFDWEEILDLSMEFGEADDYSRTAGSAKFLLARMHVLVHGIVPHGVSQGSEKLFFRVSQSMIDFVNEEIGSEEAAANIDRARNELAGRPDPVNQKQATQMMFNYYRTNKANLPANITRHREDLIKDIIAGLTPEEAFARHI